LDKVKDQATREWHIFSAANFACNFATMLKVLDASNALPARNQKRRELI